MTKQTIEQLALLAAQTEDQTVDNTPEYDNSPPEAGTTIGRFIDYVEVGKQKQRAYEGKDKPPADEIRLTFELLHPKKNIKTYEDEGVQKERAEYVTVQLTKKLNDKAKFRKLFKAMAYGRDIKHMAQMLGNEFLIKISHNTSKTTNKVYANIFDGDGLCGISAPFVEDVLAGTRTKVPVREAMRPLRIFLFDNPTKDTWDSLFIDGTRTVKDAAGVETQESKNWLQEMVLGATNYQGSALQAMLNDVGDLPMAEPVQETVAEEEPPFETGSLEDDEEAKAEAALLAAKAAKAAKAKAATPAAKPAVKPASVAQKPAGSVADASSALAALGLG